MIRNLLYSLFFHLLLILFIYLNFNFRNQPEIENKNIITVSFITKPGNSNNVIIQQPKPDISEAPEIKKPEKIAKPEKKDNTKKVKKESKPKNNLNDINAKNTETPKSPVPVKEAPDSRIERAEEIKKEPAPLAKKEQAPEIIKEKEEVKIKDIEDQNSDKEPVSKAKTHNQNFKDQEKLENIDLLAREKFNIQSQIKRCYKKAISESGKDSKALLNIHIVIDKDGSIDPDQTVIQNYEKYNDPKEIDFHIAVDNARRALILCSPIRNLPEDKYHIWKEINLQFD